MLLREFRILDTSRRIFMNGMEGNTIQFRLNKQVAFVGKVNFPVGEESLGSIHVEISSDNEEDLMKKVVFLGYGCLLKISALAPGVTVILTFVFV